MYLVDTNIISAGAPGKRWEQALADWLDRRSDDLYLSAVTISEIIAGIAKAEREEATRKAVAFRLWLEAINKLYARRILPFELAVAREAGLLTDKVRALGQNPGFADIAIAATAKCHGLVLLTRNVRHFEPMGISLADPFLRLPD